jgi:hypothetical protein
MQEKQNLKELLYGKSLQSLVTSALISLESKKPSNDILLKTVLNEILIRRPELEKLITDYKTKRHVLGRIYNCIKQLSKTNLVEIERKKTLDLDYNYIVLTPKLL